ncbi:MAG: DNA pilot protein [Arizlama microvirus]|nr:MAG: DNA pilot protein [Arizlama microvirus]
MGFMDFLGNTAKSLVTGVTGAIGDLPGTLISGAINQFSAKQAFDRNKEAASEAFDRSYGAYKTRYQDTASDMRAAGINPIMAASGGFNVGGQPSMSSAQAPMSQSPTMGSSATSGKTVAEEEKVKYEKTEILSRISKMGEEAALATQQSFESRAREGVANQQEENLKQELTKLKAETLKVAAETFLTTEQTRNTSTQRQLIIQNIREMKAIADRLAAVNKVYEGPAGEYLGFIEALMKALNIHNIITPGRDTGAPKPKIGGKK